MRWLAERARGLDGGRPVGSTPDEGMGGVLDRAVPGRGGEMFGGSADCGPGVCARESGVLRVAGPRGARPSGESRAGIASTISRHPMVVINKKTQGNWWRHEAL